METLRCSCFPKLILINGPCQHSALGKRQSNKWYRGIGDGSSLMLLSKSQDKINSAQQNAHLLNEHGGNEQKLEEFDSVLSFLTAEPLLHLPRACSWASHSLWGKLPSDPFFVWMKVLGWGTLQTVMLVDGALCPSADDSRSSNGPFCVGCICNHLHWHQQLPLSNEHLIPSHSWLFGVLGCPGTTP